MGGECAVIGNEDQHLSVPKDEQRQREKSHLHGWQGECPQMRTRFQLRGKKK